MSDLALLVIAMSVFVGGHLLLSHGMRAALVRAVGDRGFMGVYAVVALGSLVWAGELWKRVPPDRLWDTPGWAYAAAPFVMLLAFILLVGSVTTPNPALVGGGAPGAGKIRGVQAITRHPMNWGIALWAVVHITLSADSRTLVLAGGLLALALLGSAMQDRRKSMADPGYARHVAATSFVPFAGQMTGNRSLATLWPGAVAGIGGLVLWGLALWLHPMVIGVQALRG